MVDSKYSSDNYKTLKTSTGAIIKDPEMLRFVPDHLNAKAQPAFTCSKLTIEILEQGVKYVQS